MDTASCRVSAPASFSRITSSCVACRASARCHHAHVLEAMRSLSGVHGRLAYFLDARVYMVHKDPLVP